MVHEHPTTQTWLVIISNRLDKRYELFFRKKNGTNELHGEHSVHPGVVVKLALAMSNLIWMRRTLNSFPLYRQSNAAAMLPPSFSQRQR